VRPCPVLNRDFEADPRSPSVALNIGTASIVDLLEIALLIIHDSSLQFINNGDLLAAAELFSAAQAPMSAVL
jgi:hypothetical protein